MNTVAKYLPVLIPAVIYIGTALVNTMPPKGSTWTAQTWYDWFFDFSHMLVNSRAPQNPSSGGTAK